MHASTRSKALRSLDGMAEVVLNEMLATGQYIFDELEPDKAGGVCGGHKRCAIGALWAGAGVKVIKEKDSWGDVSVNLPGASQDTRDQFLAERPGLKVAYDCINDAAAAFIEEHGIESRIDRNFEAAIEQLFEGTYAETESEATYMEYYTTRSDLLTVIEDAKARVLASA